MQARASRSVARVEAGSIGVPLTIGHGAASDGAPRVARGDGSEIPPSRFDAKLQVVRQ